jgi:hypothetical protein
MNKQALTDPGLPSDRMPEAEVALRLAAFLLSLPRSGSIASVAIDGASLKVRNLIVLDIGRFMTGAGWEQDGSRSSNRRLAGTPGPARISGASQRHRIRVGRLAISDG